MRTAHVGVPAVVTIAHGRHDHLSAQQRSLLLGSVRPSAYVVVAIDDTDVEGVVMPDQHTDVVHVPTDPRGLPLAAARNAGVVRAFAGGADVAILLDVDCLAGRDLVQGYAEATAMDPATLWSGPVTYLPPVGTGGYDLATLPELDDPHPARPAPAPGALVRGAPPDLFWSLSFAVHRSAWDRVGGFCEDYVGYGAEDTDFGHLAVSRGVGLGWAGSPRAYHQHHESGDPPVEHVDDILRNGRIFHKRWGRWPMEGWLRALERRGLVESDGTGWGRRCDSPAHTEVTTRRSST